MNVRVPLSRPDISDAERSLVMSVFEGPFLSMGSLLPIFEEEFAAYLGARYAVACSSGTAALHMLIRALGIGEGDTVITTPFSFVASSNALLYEKAIPVFADIESETLCMDPNEVESLLDHSVKAILSVDVFGHPADLKRIKALGDKWDIPVLQDACEALGSRYMGVMVGNPRFSAGSVFGFYPNKQITTGEGGMVVTDDEHIAKLCRSMRNQGRSPGDTWLCHEILGFNYRLDELSAALGLAQIRRLDDIVARRKQVAQWYSDLLRDMDRVTLPMKKPEADVSWFVYVVRFDESISRDGVASFLKQRGIDTRPYFPPIHLQPLFRRLFGYREGDFPNAEKAGRSTLALPFYSCMQYEEVSYVVDALKEAIE